MRGEDLVEDRHHQRAAADAEQAGEDAGDHPGENNEPGEQGELGRGQGRRVLHAR
jgi:hypothetical protein